jgi:hypothetical protein
MADVIKTVGTREEVWAGTAKRTSGRLTKTDLMLKGGRLVSKKQSELAQKRYAKMIQTQTGLFKLCKCEGKCEKCAEEEEPKEEKKEELKEEKKEKPQRRPDNVKPDKQGGRFNGFSAPQLLDIFGRKLIDGLKGQELLERYNRAADLLHTLNYPTYQAWEHYAGSDDYSKDDLMQMLV